MHAILTADSVTELGPEARGTVLVAGSHGGRLAASYASRAGVYAVIFNDAGIGKDEAGISGLAALEALGMAAAAASHATARIGEARSMWDSGVLSHVNAPATALGARIGQPLAEFFGRAFPV